MSEDKESVPGFDEILPDDSKSDLVHLLRSGHTVVSDTHGHSMEPLLKEGRTKVAIKPLDRKPEIGDIVLWWRWDGVYMLHRMVDEDEERYILRGDNTIKTNRALKRRVIGIVTDIYRNGRWFPVTDKRYLLYVRIWMKLFPLRRCWMRFRHNISKHRQKS